MKKYSKFVIIFLIMLFPITAYAGCPLGPSVTGDLSGALKIMRILAPVIVIIYSFKDGVQALYGKDIDANSKAVYKKFLKRIAYAVLLFVIPVIVDLLMQVMNVWDETGHCTIEDTSGKSAEVGPTNGSGSASAEELGTKNGASADKLGNDKNASAEKLGNDKNASAEKLGDDKSASGDLGNQNKNANGELGDQGKKASADELQPKTDIIVIGN